MPRNSSGTYSLPAAYNPVVANTDITVDWGNTTLDDVAQGVTDSLDRQGRGAMLAALRLYDGSVGTPGLSFSNETTSGLYRPSSNNLAIAVAGAQAALINASGFLSVGYVQARSLLQAGEVVLATQNANAANATQFFVGHQTADVTLGNARNGYLSLFTNNTERARLDASGNLGLGTTSPDNRLEVVVGDGAGVNIEQSGSGQTGWLNFRDSDGALAGRVGYDHTNDRFAFHTATSVRAYLTGIGLGVNAVPSVALHADGGATSEVGRFASTGDTYLSLYRSGTRRMFLQAATTGASLWFEDNLPLTIATNNAARMTIAAAGNVTINQPSSGTALTVAGVAGGTRVLTLNGGYTDYQLSGSSFGYIGDRSGVIGSGSGMTIRSEGTLTIANGGANVYTEMSSASFNTLLQGRFAGWNGAPGSSLTGLAMEIGISSSEGYLLAYNRGGTTYAPLNYQGTLHKFRTAAGTVVAEVTTGDELRYAGIEVGWRDVVRASYNASPGAAYRGQCMAATGGVTISNATFSAGNTFSIYNDSGSSITITQGSGFTLRWAGTTSTGNRTLAPRGMCTIWMNGASEGVISGAGLT